MDFIKTYADMKINEMNKRKQRQPKVSNEQILLEIKQQNAWFEIISDQLDSLNIRLENIEAELGLTVDDIDLNFEYLENKKQEN